MLPLVMSLALFAAAHGADGRVRYEGGRAVVFFEAGRLAPAQMERFAGLVERGIRDIEAYLGREAESRRVRFYVSSRITMSRAYRGTVLLPLDRVERDRAPYLHETVHALVPVRCDCLWLGEGFASFVQSHVAERFGGYDGHVFSRGGNGNVDRLAREYLSSERGRAVLGHVGSSGSPEQIDHERWRVAAPYYVLSHSFVKFLVERAGLEQVQAALDGPDAGASLERTSGRSLARWKADWLEALARE